MDDNVTMCPKCEREVAVQAKRCPFCDFDLKHYRQLIGEEQPAKERAAASIEDLKRALQSDARRQTRLDALLFGGVIVVAAGYALLNLASGTYDFAGSFISLSVALVLIGVGLRAAVIIFSLPRVWQLLIKIAEQQAELLAELQNARTPETPRHP